MPSESGESVLELSAVSVTMTVVWENFQKSLKVSSQELARGVYMYPYI